MKLIISLTTRCHSFLRVGCSCYFAAITVRNNTIAKSIIKVEVNEISEALEQRDNEPENAETEMLNS